METAVNALWDAAPVVGDRIAVIGAGMVGCCIARLLARIPGVEVTLVDIDPDRGEAASALGARFATPATAPTGQDLMFHTSATPEGLELALELLVPGGEVVELSWFGDTEVPLRLGGPFHSGRLAIRGSQVGTVAPRRSYRTTADRMTLALELLRDPALDHVIGTRTAFDDLPHRMHELVDGADSRCHIVTYERA